MLGEDLVAKLRRLYELRETRDIDAKTAENSEKQYRAFEQEVFEELANSPLVGAQKVDLGGDIGVITFTPTETTFGRILDKDRAVESFKEMARDDEFAEVKISKARLNEYVRECLDNNTSLPEGVDFYTNRRVGISKPKAKSG